MTLAEALATLPSGTKIWDGYLHRDVKVFVDQVLPDYPPGLTAEVARVRGITHGLIVIDRTTDAVGVPIALTFWTPMDHEWRKLRVAKLAGDT